MRCAKDPEGACVFVASGCIVGEHTPLGGNGLQRGAGSKTRDNLHTVSVRGLTSDESAHREDGVIQVWRHEGDSHHTARGPDSCLGH